MFDLSGRFALVTGAGQGIGAGIARHLATQGARVLVNDYFEERAHKTVGAISKDGAEASPIAFDVTDHEAVVRHLGPLELDIVINNAGNAGNAGAKMMQPSSFRDMAPELWAWQRTRSRSV